MTAEAVMEKPRPRVAVVDNDGAEVGIHLLEEVADVDVFTDPEEAETAIEHGSYKVVVADLLMPKMNGNVLLSRLIKKEVKTRFVVRSGVCSQTEAADRSFFSDHEIDVSDKLTVTGKEFYEGIGQMVTGASDNGDDRFGLSELPKSQSSILDMSYDQFRRLSQEDRYLAVELARESIDDEVTREFDSGAVWFMYGGKGRKNITAYEYREVPSRDEIDRICRERNIPIIQYFRGAEIDDLVLEWRDNCSESAQNYPLVGLSPNATPETTVPIHFDTGSPVSFADFDILDGFFANLGDRTDASFVPFPVNGRRMPVTLEKVHVYFMDANGGSPKVEINFIVPKEWSKFPNRERLCAKSCSRRANEAGPDRLLQYGLHEHEGKPRYYCKFRWGLIGREFLLENGFRMVLDGRRRLAHLLEEEE